MNVGLQPKQERSILTRQKLLDATVEELLAGGYSTLSTAGVARRAGVSRGAQQHHFYSKDELIIEAVRELAVRQIAELRESAEQLPATPEHLRHVLETMLSQLSGPLFAATLELSLAARGNVEIQQAIKLAEREMGSQIRNIGRQLLADLPNERRQIDLRWSMALNTIRGHATLLLLGHSRARVAEQWSFAREELVAMLSWR